jgi:hypothetical protein
MVCGVSHPSESSRIRPKNTKQYQIAVSDLDFRLQMLGKPGKKAMMPLARNGTDCSEKADCRENRQEAQTNQRRGFEAARFEISVGWFNYFVEISNLLPKLSADAAYKQITESRHPPQHHRRTMLSPAIRLRQQPQDDVTLLHRLRSEAE